jgi:hypothetical protein
MDNIISYLIFKLRLLNSSPKQLTPALLDDFEDEQNHYKKVIPSGLIVTIAGFLAQNTGVMVQVKNPFCQFQAFVGTI